VENEPACDPHGQEIRSTNFLKKFENPGLAHLLPRADPAFTLRRNIDDEKLSRLYIWRRQRRIASRTSVHEFVSALVRTRDPWPNAVTSAKLNLPEPAPERVGNPRGGELVNSLSSLKPKATVRDQEPVVAELAQSLDSVCPPVAYESVVWKRLRFLHDAITRPGRCGRRARHWLIVCFKMSRPGSSCVRVSKFPPACRDLCR